MKQVIERNKRIDQLLQSRQDGLYNFAKATKELVDMGMKITNQETGEIDVPRSFEAYIEHYNRSNMEFEWQVEYTDGTVLNQFDAMEHHFGNIDQAKIATVSWISNFAWPTDNIERRVIVSLDWKTGTFSFMNGFAPQEVKGAVMNPIEGEKKLIMFTKKRVSETVGMIAEDIKTYYLGQHSLFNYNQFILGFETPSGEERAILVQPNGNIELFNKSR